jgi:hypothetical protein
MCKNPKQKYCPNAGTRCCDSCYPPINCWVRQTWSFEDFILRKSWLIKK